jgi:hypothetical protein
VAFEQNPVTTRTSLHAGDEKLCDLVVPFLKYGSDCHIAVPDTAVSSMLKVVAALTSTKRKNVPHNGTDLDR